MSAAGADFVFIKASQQVEDDQFKHSWKNAKSAGLLRGAYHYLDWRMSELTQAALFTGLLVGDVGELPPVLDLEMNPAPLNLTKGVIQGKVWNFLQAVEKATGRIPMIYSGFYYWLEWMNTNTIWARYPFWLAWYAKESIVKVPPPWPKWTFWQYTDKSVGLAFGGETGGMDLSYFNGTVDELRKFAVIPPVNTLACPFCGHELDQAHWKYTA
jgi:lysozyme